MARRPEGGGVNGLIKATPRRLRAGVGTLRDKVEEALRRLAAWLFGLFFLLLLAAIPALLFLTSTAGLGDAVRTRSEALLGGNNYEVHLDKVLFSPARGFVLKGLQGLRPLPREASGRFGQQGRRVR